MSFAQKINQLFRRKPIAAAASGDSSMMGDTVVQDLYDGSLNSVQGAPSVFGVEEAARGDELVSLPILGTATTAKHQRTLFTLLGGSVLVLVVLSAWMLREANNSNQQLAATGQALMQSQRLAKSVSIAMTGAAPAFADVKDSAGVLARNVRALAGGDSDLGVNALGGGLQDELSSISTLMERAEKSAGLILGQQKTLTQVGDALRTINRQSSDLLETAETISSLKLQQGAGAAEISAAGQLVMLTQRIAKSANEFQTLEGVSPEAVFLLGKDLNSFKEISEGLLNGSAEMRLSAARDPQVREQLETLIKQYDDTRTQASAILGNLQGLVSAREAQASINNDSEPLRQQLEQLQTALQGLGGASMLQLALLAVAILAAVLSGVGISRVQLLDSRARQQEAERHQVDARLQEQEAKRINDANQAAILRLMNELQSVAEGDLTQEATVTEDITGAIADSVNYTVEELRALVGSVQNTVTRVAQTTEQVDVTSTELLAASNEQLHEIRETGKSILDMAGRINNVSAQAQESAQVARQSLQAADSGLKAVQNAIGGMNSIRDQIQDTSKRIKRLGESSQEIGEITELISDITEQTNVLALNAAIQAASAGEAGRGFSVVAEEVQRLAERSADATRQIAALVKAIQTDTQDAVAAMERSTQGVVEGARLSDSAGTALSEIDSVSRRLAELIEQISNSTSREANMANGVAENIQHIFAVTEQTGEGTRTTAQQVRELSHMAEELRQSVSRFKIA
ncbi:methyl-accepting chemotaxis protein [Comamonas testosteroni]|uniref:methyl-accepting chemotaxis protein n=1 Tax=Comamonas testosteroni TaxID=285 RepID=UPI003899D609